MTILIFEKPDLKLRKKKLSSAQKEMIRNFREYERVKA
jgi:hypothetical protein